MIEETATVNGMFVTPRTKNHIVKGLTTYGLCTEHSKLVTTSLAERDHSPRVKQILRQETCIKIS